MPSYVVAPHPRRDFLKVTSAFGDPCKPRRRNDLSVRTRIPAFGLDRNYCGRAAIVMSWLLLIAVPRYRGSQGKSGVNSRGYVIEPRSSFSRRLQRAVANSSPALCRDEIVALCSTKYHEYNKPRHQALKTSDSCAARLGVVSFSRIVPFLGVDHFSVLMKCSWSSPGLIIRIGPFCQVLD
jgi:hypothetical protein